MIYGAILAGGVGSRMQNTDIPKQFLELDGKPIIIHTLEKMLMNDRLDVVYIGINPSWLSFCEDLVKKNGCASDRVRIVAGGADRNGTIINVINDIKAHATVTDEDIIVTHDAVRPFLTQRIIDDNIDAAIKHGACDTVVKASDTIVRSEGGDFITEIPDRKPLYQGQTPQSFKINLLQKCFDEMTEEESAILTDACKICVLKGHPVALVEGEVLNFKITTVGDYQMARAMLLIK